MNCDFNKEYLLAYLDEELSDELHQKTKEHLATCAECQQEVASLKQTHTLWQETLNSQSLKPDFLVNIKQRLAVKPYTSTRQILLRWAPLAAACLLIAIGLVIVLRPRPITEPVTPIATKLQEFRLSDGSQIIASLTADIIINESERQVSLKQGGELFVKVTKGNKPFKLNTRVGTVIVKGTEFLVKVYNELQLPTQGKEEKILSKWIISVLIVTGSVQLSTPMGDIIGTGGEMLYAEEGSAPIKKRIEDLSKTVSALAQELKSTKQELESIMKQLAEAERLIQSSKPANQFANDLLTGQSANERTSKMREFGKIFVKAKRNMLKDVPDKSEQLRLISELMKISNELGLEPLTIKDYLPLFTKPETRQYLVNIAIGEFEELGYPLSKDQIRQYEAVVEKMGEIENKIINEYQTPIERLIARLQNADITDSLLKELHAIFNADQREQIAKGLVNGILASFDKPVVKSSIIEFKEQGEASNYVLQKWLSILNLSPEERNIIKPISEQYIRDYCSLRKTMEGTFSKDIMDYYFERNKPTDKSKLTQYYQERDKLFQTNPDYAKAKTVSDIEFLKLQLRYYKEISNIIGIGKASALLNMQPGIYHFPNID